MIVCDPARTAARYDALRRYMDEHVSDGADFHCAMEPACRASLDPGLVFSAGQLSYVGPYYDISDAGYPLRVLIVGMDTGRTHENVSLDERRHQIFERVPERFSQRNPHMRGTTLALRLLFGRDPATDRDGELLPLDRSRAMHVLEAYAMANLRLCSATSDGSTASRGTATMSRNCMKHLAATIDILDPTIVVLQGARIRKSVNPLVDDAARVAPNVETVRLGNRRAVLVSLSHPSYPGPRFNWANATSPYLLSTVVPALRNARAVAIGETLGDCSTSP